MESAFNYNFNIIFHRFMDCMLQNDMENSIISALIFVQFTSCSVNILQGCIYLITAAVL